MSDVEDVLAASGKAAPAYLIVGEEFLVRRTAEELVERLVPPDASDLSQVVLDGASPREIAQELATMSLFSGPKVVRIHDPEFLAPKRARGDGLAKARDAWKAGRRKEGARRVLALTTRASWSLDEWDPAVASAATAGQWKSELGVELADADIGFLTEVAALCREEGLTAPEGDTSVLVNALERGLPPGHVLVVAASEVDPKNPLVRAIQDVGCVLERRIASKLRELDISDVVTETLGPLGKKLGYGAEALLKDRCGANLRLLQSELEKLALYADGPTIRSEDVELLVHRAREEEFLDLSEALQKRDLAASLRYARDALEQGSAPLQLLGAIASILRTLAGHADRLQRHAAGGPLRMSFNDFKSDIFPALEKEAKAAQERVPHPYAAYAGMQAAGRYGPPALRRALVACAEADVALKSSGNGQLVLERLLWGVCGNFNG